MQEAGHERVRVQARMQVLAGFIKMGVGSRSLHEHQSWEAGFGSLLNHDLTRN
jgi:hypothetical protein